MTSVDDVTAALQSTRVTPSGVSFAGKSLKLDNAATAQVIVDAISNTSTLEFLNLEGNTLGVEAAEAIAKALEKHPEFKRALWKDMFTGRLKTEIPQALKYLGDGLVKAEARLTELDLSDNAFGPIGVEGLAALLRSSTCFALEELKLNNNGLGITGGKLLAGALMDCYNSSKEQGRTLALKVFIAGRNRLENEGAKALANVFKTLGTLEEISMPQNGIYHVGITALSEAFSVNKNLQVLNLNDNTIGWKGANAIARALPNLQNLQVINFGDSLLKTKGAISLAQALEKEHLDLVELILGFNEIGAEGGIALVNSISNKSKLKSLVLDGNQFNKNVRTQIQTMLKQNGKFNTLTSLEECDSEEDVSNSEDDDDERGSDSENDDSNVKEVTDVRDPIITFEKFESTPTVDNFIKLGNQKELTILNAVKKNTDSYMESLISAIMKISALSINNDREIEKSVLVCSEVLYKELFQWAQQKNELSLLTNTLLVYLGLIKSEDKKFKPTWKTEGCLSTLEKITNETYIPQTTKDTLRFFMGKKIIELNDTLN